MKNDERLRKSREWKEKNKARVQASRKAYYNKTKNKPKEVTALRECKCGILALSEEDL